MNVVCANAWVGTVSKWGWLFYLFLMVAYIVAEKSKMLSVHERILCIFQLVAWPIVLVCLRLAFNANGPTLTRKLSFATAFLCVVVLHGTATVLNLIEYGDKDCTRDIFSICSFGQKNFFVMIFISLLVQIFFYTVEHWIWTASTYARPFNSRDVSHIPDEVRQRTKPAQGEEEASMVVQNSSEDDLIIERI